METEKRLIDANKADVEDISCYYGSNCYIEDVQSWLDEQPAVDAVEVVRCKDCKKGHPELAPNGGVWCAKWNHIFCDDGFCSYGEGRTDG